MFDPNQIPWYVWFISGILIGVGILTALDDRLTARVTAQDNLGWWLIIAGASLLLFWFLIPFFPIIWEAVLLLWQRGSATMAIGLGIGITLLLLGIVLTSRRQRRANP